MANYTTGSVGGRIDGLTDSETGRQVDGWVED